MLKLQRVLEMMFQTKEHMQAWVHCDEFWFCLSLVICWQIQGKQTPGIAIVGLTSVAASNDKAAEQLQGVPIILAERAAY